MKPTNDPNCKCHQIEKECGEVGDKDWNIGDSCRQWHKRSKKELKNNNIEYEDGSDEYYGCCCPTCGRMICGWCV